jgi:hypothetical protein
MALPATGPISMSQVNVELSRTATATISLGETAVRNLAGKPSGAISMGDLLGKSAYTPMSLSYTGGFGQVFSGSCVSVSAAATVTVTGGTPPYSFQWTRTSGFTTPTSRTVSSTTSTSDSLTVSQVLCPNGEASSTYSVLVSDNIGGGVEQTASINVFYNLINFGGGGGSEF